MGKSCMFLSPADIFYKIDFFDKIFQEYHQSVICDFPGGGGYPPPLENHKF